MNRPAPVGTCYRWLAGGLDELLVVVADGLVTRIGWRCLGAAPPAGAWESEDLVPGLARRLVESLSGIDHDYQDVPLPEGTPFQRDCWARTRGIPAGTTLTYGELASELGRPGAARAAGQALRANPLPLVVPCHRVVRTAGGTGGFCGAAGADDPAVLVKSRLLAREHQLSSGTSKRAKSTGSRRHARSTKAYNPQLTPRGAAARSRARCD
ncbi:MAG: methylated-DNA--[protein]-cysteine S-methyltransferase [Planctomycetota bacterium]|nr:methylated-DNA--[protein]-cysteine S-methyltransferase [Planctomycetota bacterium]